MKKKPYVHCSPIYNETKYVRWYYNIVEKALSEGRKKSKKQYYERHHIVPKSIGGCNDAGNLVLLTAKEHFIVHLLLVKMLEGFDTNSMTKMMHAMNILVCVGEGHKQRYTAAQYEIARRLKSKAMTEYNNARWADPDARRKASERVKKYYDDDPCARRKSSEAIKKTWADDPEKRRAQSERIKAYPKKTCPHCNRAFDPGNYVRHIKAGCKHAPQRESSSLLTFVAE